MSLIADLKRPFNVLSLTVGVLGVALAVYSYVRPYRDRSISYLYTGASKIFDSKSSSPRLRLTDEKGQPVTQDVWVIGLTLWNSGSEPIEPTDVRKPVKLVLIGAGRILDAAIVQEKDAEVSKVRLSPDLSDTVAPGKAVGVTWDHLDQGHGTKLQLIVSSDESIRLGLEGEIVGVRSFTNEGVLSGTARTSIVAFAAAMALLIIVRAVIRYRRKQMDGADLVFVLMFATLVGIPVTLLLLSIAGQLMRDAPPF